MSKQRFADIPARLAHAGAVAGWEQHVGPFLCASPTCHKGHEASYHLVAFKDGRIGIRVTDNSAGEAGAQMMLTKGQLEELLVDLHDAYDTAFGAVRPH